MMSTQPVITQVDRVGIDDDDLPYHYLGSGEAPKDFGASGKHIKTRSPFFSSASSPCIRFSSLFPPDSIAPVRNNRSFLFFAPHLFCCWVFIGYALYGSCPIMKGMSKALHIHTSQTPTSTTDTLACTASLSGLLAWRPLYYVPSVLNRV